MYGNSIVKNDIVFKSISSHTTIYGTFHGQWNPFIRFGLSIITTEEFICTPCDSSYVFSAAC